MSQSMKILDKKGNDLCPPTLLAKNNCFSLSGVNLSTSLSNELLRNGKVALDQHPVRLLSNQSLTDKQHTAISEQLNLFILQFSIIVGPKQAPRTVPQSLFGGSDYTLRHFPRDSHFPLLVKF